VGYLHISLPVGIRLDRTGLVAQAVFEAEPSRRIGLDGQVEVRRMHETRLALSARSVALLEQSLGADVYPGLCQARRLATRSWDGRPADQTDDWLDSDAMLTVARLAYLASGPVRRAPATLVSYLIAVAQARACLLLGDLPRLEECLEALQGWRGSAAPLQGAVDLLRDDCDRILAELSPRPRLLMARRHLD
jgi:hypothetical protein